MADELTDRLRDPDRLTALRRTGLLDSPPEPAFDRLTRLASTVLKAPVALVSLVDDHRQFFKSGIGLGEPWASARQTPLTHSLCQHIIASGEPLVVADARVVPILCGNLAVAELGVVAYLGVPLIDAEGHRLGALCVIEGSPREWEGGEVDILRDLAASVMTEVELREELRRQSRAEEALRDSERRYRLLAENSTDMISRYGPDGVFLYASPSCRRLLGYDPEELIGRSVYDLIHPDDLAATARVGEALLSSPEAQMSTCRLRHKDGRYVWVEGALRAVLDPLTGAIAEVHCASRDVTERVRAEAELRESETRLQAILDNVAAVAYLKDAQGRYLLVNRRWADLFSVTKEAVVGKTDHELFPAPIADAFRANDRMILESKRACEIEEVAPHSDGLRTYISVKAPLFDAEGSPYGLCGISTDITERKETETALRLSEERFHMAVQATNDAIWDRDLRTDAIWWNESVTRLFGYSLEEVGRDAASWYELLHPEDRERVAATVHAAAHDGARTWTVKYRFRRKDGTYAPIIDRGILQRDEHGEATRMIGSMMDLTRIEEVETALRESRERLVAALSASGTGIYRWDIETGVVDGDEQLDRLFGLPPGDHLGSLDQFLVLIHPEDRAGVVDCAQRCVTEGTDFNAEYRIVWPDGSVHWLADRGKTFFDDAGRPLHQTGGCVDITDRKRAEERLVHQASHDALTGLPNRTLLKTQVERCIASSPGGDARFSLLLLDLDRFKEINDTFGHPYGDAVLRQLSPRLLEAVRDSDVVARLGGDEFGILLPGLDEERAIAIAGRILQGLESAIVVDGQGFDVGVSIGIAVYPEHGLDVATLMKHADVAMYAAKRARSGRAVYAAGQADLSPRRMRLGGELRHAIADGQLRLHYQPMVDLRTMQPVGAEALVRWQHPSDGLLGPGEFIPFAEQTGLIRPLGLWAFEEALRQFRAWRSEGLELRVAVNLAPENLQDDQLIETIDRLLAEADAPSRWLTVEVTESAMMADPARAKAVLARLHRMGVLIAIDDFGTGYSSLAYLKELPVDKVKIDRSFVRDMVHNERDACIVRSVIDLGHNLGLRVVAEGVEDRATLELFASWGCDLAQGYYIGRPMPPGGVPDWLVEWAGRNERAGVAYGPVGTSRENPRSPDTGRRSTERVLAIRGRG